MCANFCNIFIYVFTAESISTEEIVTVEKYDLVTKEMEIKKSNLVTALPYIAKEYKISFDLFVTEHQAAISSVIHFTTDGNMGKYGDRIPGIWIFKKKLEIMSAVSGNHNYHFIHTTDLEEGKWINVEISQTLVGDKVRKAIKIRCWYYLGIYMGLGVNTDI